MPGACLNLVAITTNLQVSTPLGYSILATSTNGGFTWSQQHLAEPPFNGDLALSADGTRLLAGPHISPDFGNSWIDINGAPTGFACCSADGSRMFIAFNAGISGSSGAVNMSLDSGFTWSNPVFGTNFNGVACSADGSTVVAVGQGSMVGQGPMPYICSSPRTSAPGAAGYLFGARLSSIELQYLGNGVFMPISHIGTFRWK